MKGEKYSEVFIAMGKKYAMALPELSKYNVNVVFPTCGGPGPKAKALKEWLCKVKGSKVAACHRALQH